MVFRHGEETPFSACTHSGTLWFKFPLPHETAPKLSLRLVPPGGGVFTKASKGVVGLTLGVARLRVSLLV